MRKFLPDVVGKTLDEWDIQKPDFDAGERIKKIPYWERSYIKVYGFIPCDEFLEPQPIKANSELELKHMKLSKLRCLAEEERLKQIEQRRQDEQEKIVNKSVFNKVDSHQDVYAQQLERDVGWLEEVGVLRESWFERNEMLSPWKSNPYDIE